MEGRKYSFAEAIIMGRAISEFVPAYYNYMVLHNSAIPDKSLEKIDNTSQRISSANRLFSALNSFNDAYNRFPEIREKLPEFVRQAQEAREHLSKNYSFI